jgi:hypothetical protein
MVYVDKKRNPFTPHEGYFSWSTKNIFQVDQYFTLKQTVLRNEVFLIHLEENISEKNKAKHHT